jgi:hypothetical protein
VGPALDRGFKCAGGKRNVLVTYDDKILLFDRHLHLVEQPEGSS